MRWLTMSGVANGMIRGLRCHTPNIGFQVKPLLFGELRQVHNTAKKHHTSLMTSDVKHSTFHKMSLNVLKSECRIRGLKVSGRKAELVDRITSFEGGAKQKKDAHPKPLPRSQPAQKRRISSSAALKISQAKSKQLCDETSKIAAARQRSEHTTEGPFVEEQAPGQTSHKVNYSKAAETETVDQTGLGNPAIVDEKLTLKDKLFLLGFGTVATLWWGYQG